jgi:DNA polymerase (family 10)
MREKAPEGVLSMLRIPGLKPDRVRKLYADLGIASVEELEEAARSGRLTTVKGFGPAFQAKVLQGIEMSRRPQGRHIHRAAALLRQQRNSSGCTLTGNRSRPRASFGGDASWWAHSRWSPSILN